MPSYYFNPENKDAEKHLDNLLLTQGWRRFSWSHLSRLEKEPQFGFEPGLSLAGRVHTVSEKPTREPHRLTMLVSNLYGMPIVYEGMTDSLGNFAFTGMDYSGSVGVYMQAYTEKEKKVGQVKELKKNDLTIYRVEIPMPGFGSPADFVPAKNYADFDNYLVTVKGAKNMMEQFRLNQEIELGEVTVTGKRSELLPDKRAIQYNNEPDAAFVVTDEHVYFQNVFQLLRGRFPGVDVRGDVFSISPPPTILIRGGAPSMSGLGGATLFIDGMRAMPGTVAVLPVAEIERIDILRD